MICRQGFIYQSSAQVQDLLFPTYVLLGQTRHNEYQVGIWPCDLKSHPHWVRILHTPHWLWLRYVPHTHDSSARALDFLDKFSTLHEHNFLGYHQGPDRCLTSQYPWYHTKAYFITQTFMKCGSWTFCSAISFTDMLEFFSCTYSYMFRILVSRQF